MACSSEKVPNEDLALVSVSSVRASPMAACRPAPQPQFLELSNLLLTEVSVCM